MNVPAGPDTLPFGDFLAVLRARGFTIGVEHHLRLARLLDRAGSSIAPADLKRLLCPLFATDAAEQEAFYAAFDSYFAAILAESASIATDGAVIESLERSRGSTMFRRIFWTALVLLAALICALLLPTPDTSTAGKAKPIPMPTIEEAPKVSSENKPPADAQPTPGATTPPAPAPAAAVEKKPTILPEEKPVAAAPPMPALPPALPSLPARSLAMLREHSVALHGLALALPVLGFAFGEWRRWRRRELLIERARGRKPPFTWPVRVAAPKIREFHSQPLYAAARALRRRQAADTERLDLAATLQATIRAGGLPRLVYRRGSRVPEYLVLIDCASPRDHQAALFDQLAVALEREGVFVVRYFYRVDPRVCWDERVSRPLTELRRLHPEHRVLIFGDGAGLLDPVSGAPAAWLPLLCEWRERVLLTPAPASRWGWREETIETQLAVLPATVEALATVPDLLERGASGAGLAMWRDDAPAPPPARALSIETVRAYLGEDAFEWLCACAIYPELQWNLTLHLGAQMPGAATLLTEAMILRLARLPWLRDGALPEDIRTQLLAALPIERQRALRLSVVGLLEASPPPAGSHAADARQLDIAIQRHWLSRHERTALENVPPVAALPFGEQTRDYAELRLHEAGSGSRLALRLPSRLRALLYDRATPGLGFRPALRGLIAVLIAWCGWAVCELGTTEPTPKLVLTTEFTWDVASGESSPLPPKQLAQNPNPLQKKPEPLPPLENVALKASAAAAQALEDREDWPRAIAAWTEVAQQFPELNVGKTHLEFIFGNLNGRAEKSKTQEFLAVRKVAEEAAELKVQAALMFLAENLRETDPEASYAHYSAAAELEVVSALTMKGVMLANGYGCEKNLAEALKYLEKAAATPDGFRAKAALADLYLHGSDVLAKNDVKAVELLQEAIDAGNLRAMDQLATCYDKGIGIAVDYKKAFELYSRAAELGFHHSLGNLAVLYINGKVSNRSEPLKAIALLKQGIKAGDDFCLFLYARCLESGTGAKPNRALARDTYKEAAEAGNLEAAKWCVEHGVRNARGESFELERKVILPPPAGTTRPQHSVTAGLKESTDNKPSDTSLKGFLEGAARVSNLRAEDLRLLIQVRTQLKNWQTAENALAASANPKRATPLSAQEISDVTVNLTAQEEALSKLLQTARKRSLFGDGEERLATAYVRLAEELQRSARRVRVGRDEIVRLIELATPDKLEKLAAEKAIFDVKELGADVNYRMLPEIRDQLNLLLPELQKRLDILFKPDEVAELTELDELHLVDREPRYKARWSLYKPSLEELLREEGPAVLVGRQWKPLLEAIERLDALGRSVAAYQGGTADKVKAICEFCLKTRRQGLGAFYAQRYNYEARQLLDPKLHFPLVSPVDDIGSAFLTPSMLIEAVKLLEKIALDLNPASDGMKAIDDTSKRPLNVLRDNLKTIDPLIEAFLTEKRDIRQVKVVLLNSATQKAKAGEYSAMPYFQQAELRTGKPPNCDPARGSTKVNSDSSSDVVLTTFNLDQVFHFHFYRDGTLKDVPTPNNWTALQLLHQQSSLPSGDGRNWIVDIRPLNKEEAGGRRDPAVDRFILFDFRFDEPVPPRDDWPTRRKLEFKSR